MLITVSPNYWLSVRGLMLILFFFNLVMWTFIILWMFFQMPAQMHLLIQLLLLTKFRNYKVMPLLYIPVYPITLGHKYDKWILLMIQEERQTVEICPLMLSLVLRSHLCKNLWNSLLYSVRIYIYIFLV